MAPIPRPAPLTPFATELEPLISSDGTISKKSTAKRSLLNTIFDTKNGRKLHKRSRSDPTPQNDCAEQVPELAFVLQPFEDAAIFGFGTNQALDAVYDASTSSREFYTCSSGSCDASYEDVDEWSISDHGTVLIRRPAGFHPTRSSSLHTSSTNHTIYEEPTTPEAEAEGSFMVAECSPENGATTYDELVGTTDKEQTSFHENNTQTAQTEA